MKSYMSLPFPGLKLARRMRLGLELLSDKVMVIVIRS